SAGFGNVVVGTTNSQTIKLTNSGTASLTISQSSVSGAGFSNSALALPLTLSAGQSTTFNVAFAPSASGSVSGTLSVASNAPHSPLAIPLSGSGVAATYSLAASPTSLSFGNVTLNLKGTLGVKLTNSGNSSVKISSLSVSGAGFSASGVSAGTTLTPGQ